MGKFLNNDENIICVVVMPRTILPQRNRCALSAAGTQKSEGEEARGVTCFMEENEIVEVVRFDEDKRDKV